MFELCRKQRPCLAGMQFRLRCYQTPGTNALVIRADARVLGATLAAGHSLTYDMAPGRKAYLVATSGGSPLTTVRWKARDGGGGLGGAHAPHHGARRHRNRAVGCGLTRPLHTS